MDIRVYKGIKPQIGDNAYIDSTSTIIGDVVIGDDCSVWPMSVIRGDVNSISVGSRTNIQDGSILHVTHRHESIPDGYALNIGSDVTVGHKVILHGCTISDRCLIGMGAIVMDGAVIEPNVLLGAGSLVPMGKVLQAGYLWLGNPVRQVRKLRQDELDWIDYSARHYLDVKNQYLENPG